MMEKENKELFLTQLTTSPAWERFVTAYENGLGQLFKNAWAVPFDEIPESFQLAALVDWLDSEGVIVVPKFWSGSFWPVVNTKNGRKIINHEVEGCYSSRSEALKAGIIQAFSLLEKKI